MVRSLSSKSTFTYKVILPALVVGSLLLGGALPFLFGPGDPRVHLNGLSPTAFLLILWGSAIPVVAIFWVTVVPLKKVALDGDMLRISNFRYEIQAPLTTVAGIDGPSFTNPKTYTIAFEPPTEFGARVMFLPPMEWSLMPTDSEAVADLRSAWETARNTARRR